MGLRNSAALVSFVALASCIGNIGDRADGSRDEDGPGEDAIGVSAGGMRRLTRPEYEATLRDLFGADAVTAAALALAALPSDRGKQQLFSSMSAGVTSEH